MLIYRLVELFRRYTSPSPDPMHQISHAVSVAIVDVGNAAGDFCTTNKTKISGTLSAVSSIALGYEGVRSGNPALITAAAVALGADAVLIRYGDPVRGGGEHNPQDKKFEWKDGMNVKDYPHETSTVGYTLQSAIMTAADFTGGNINSSMGYLAAGATDLMGSAITFFVREKENPTEKFKNAVLNLPGIKQIASLAETRTNLAAGLISVSGLAYLTISDLAKNNWSIETSAPILTFSFASLGSEIFYWFSEKRGHVREDLEEQDAPDNDINVDTPGMAKDL